MGPGFGCFFSPQDALSFSVVFLVLFAPLCVILAVCRLSLLGRVVFAMPCVDFVLVFFAILLVILLAIGGSVVFLLPGFSLGVVSSLRVVLPLNFPAPFRVFLGPSFLCVSLVTLSRVFYSLRTIAVMVHGDLVSNEGFPVLHDYSFSCLV